MIGSHFLKPLSQLRQRAFDRVSRNALRISLGLVAANLVVLLGAYSLGLIATGNSQLRQQRLRQSQTLAVQLSSAIEAGDVESIQQLTGSLLGQVPDLASIGIRTDGNALMFASEHHESLFVGGTNEAANVTVPLFDGATKWGALELHFQAEPGWSGGLVTVCVFVGVSTLFAFVVLIRRVLRLLDPSSVIPDRVRAMLDTMTEGALLLTGDCRIVMANLRFSEIAQADLEYLLGKDPAEIDWHVDDEPVPADALPWRQAAAGEACRGSILQIGRGELRRSLSVNATCIRGDNDVVRGLLVTFDDITTIEAKNSELERTVRQLHETQSRVRKQNEELSWMATRDALTGCLNRRAFQEQMASTYNLATRNGEPLSMIMVDVDHFKSVNDNHGHAKGDDVLKGVAKRLQDAVRKSDILARYGGEEFCVILPETGADGAMALADKLRVAINHAPIAELDITASFGVSSTEQADSQNELAQQSDMALYASKESGRNRATCYDPTMTSATAKKAAAKSRGDERSPFPMEAVHALLATLRFRDPLTYEHSCRVAAICVRVMEDVLEPLDLLTLEVAGLLHDIGKVGVPDDILLKPAALNDDEREIMERHDRIGCSIIESAFLNDELADIVNMHHAWFDGSSAHCGSVAGHRIPLRSRLLTIVDAFDAMTTDRPYRKAMSNETAFVELRRCAGTQFDPELVERVILVLSEDESATPEDESAARAEQLLAIGVELERVASAFEREDLMTTNAVAQRLGQKALVLGIEPLSDATQAFADAVKSLDAARIAEALTRVFETFVQASASPKPYDLKSHSSKRDAA